MLIVNNTIVTIFKLAFVIVLIIKRNKNNLFSAWYHSKVSFIPNLALTLPGRVKSKVEIGAILHISSEAPSLLIINHKLNGQRFNQWEMSVCTFKMEVREQLCNVLSPQSYGK